MKVDDGKDGVDVDDGVDTVMMKRLLFSPRERFLHTQDRFPQAMRECRQPGISLSYLPLTSLRSPVRIILPLLLTLLTLLAISSFARAEWVPLQELATQVESTVASTNGRGKAVFVEFQNSTYGWPTTGFCYVIYDLANGTRERVVPFSLPRPDWGISEIVAVIDSNEYISLLITQGSFYFTQYDSNDSIIQPIHELIPQASLQVEAPSRVDDQQRIHVVYTRFSPWGYIYLMRISSSGVIEHNSPQIYDRTAQAVNLCLDGREGAYIRIETGEPIRHLLYHVDRNYSVAGPYVIGVETGGTQREVTYSPTNNRLFCYDYHNDNNNLRIVAKEIDTTDYTILRTTIPYSITSWAGELPDFLGYSDTTWMFHPVYGYDSTGLFHILSTRLSYLTNDTNWVLSDSFSRAQLFRPLQGSGIALEIIRNGDDFLIRNNRSVLYRRVETNIPLNRFENKHSTNNITIAPNPTNGRFSLFLGGRQTNRILVYNLLGQTIASYQPHPGNLVQSILLPGSLPSGTYYLQVQSPTHPTQVLPLQYIK